MRHHQGLRTHQRLTLAAVLLLFCSVLAAQEPKVAPKSPRIQDITVQSTALQRPVKVRVLLPADYARTTRRYPVLYLLHGLYGDSTNWTTLTKLEEYTRALPLIIVMPDAGNSWYVNSATVPKDRFEDFFTSDIMPAVERRYRITAGRRHRAIAGLSMGGYGALKFALKHPEMFSVAGSFSGALNAPLDLAQQEPKFAQYLDPVFGAANSPARVNNDLLRIVRQVNPQSAPYFYVTCGTLDPYFIPINRAFTLALYDGKFAYEYDESPGGHEWPYWDRVIRRFLGVLESQGVLR